MKIFPSFDKAIRHARQTLVDVGYWVEPGKWQSRDVSKKPEMMTREVLNYSFQVALQSEDAETYRKDVRPNLPWVDDHFKERVGGHPLNPGIQWAKWPWGNSANTFRDSNGQFSHTYMERIWPKFSGLTEGGKLETESILEPRGGIRYSYGDFKDVITHLSKDPTSRQAYLPIWFPEDTGIVHGERVPCTLGYQLIQRNGFLHLVYYIRSCDIVRHFQDDIYLAVRLQIHVLKELRKLDALYWDRIKPGFYTMHITSLHAFKNDVNRFVKNGKWDENL